MGGRVWVGVDGNPHLDGSSPYRIWIHLEGKRLGSITVTANGRERTVDDNNGTSGGGMWFDVEVSADGETLVELLVLSN